jgi:hypothetical protein
MKAVTSNVTSSSGVTGSSDPTPSADRATLSYKHVYAILGPLLFPGDFLSRVPPRVQWIEKETVKKTDPPLDELKAAGTQHPAIERGHPILLPGEIRDALAVRAYYEYQTLSMDEWLDRHNVPSSEVDGELGVNHSEFEIALLKVYPKRWPKLKKKREDAAKVETSDEAESSDREAPKNRGGRPRKYSWDDALVATTVKAMSLARPLSRSEVIGLMQDWFSNADLEGGPTRVDQYAGRVFNGLPPEYRREEEG